MRNTRRLGGGQGASRGEGRVRRLAGSRRLRAAFEEAAALTRALSLRPPDAPLLVLLATVRLVEGDEEAAAELLDRAYALNPENEAVLALRRR